MGLAATNHVELVDAALLRLGRFDHLIDVPPPDAQASINPYLCCQVWGSGGWQQPIVLSYWMQHKDQVDVIT